MRAKFLNEQFERLLIYKLSDGTYEAVRNNKLYTFNWTPYKIYNLKLIGSIGHSWVPQGSLLKNPHIQMILQVQRGINGLNEAIGDIFKPKTKEEIQKNFKKKYRVPYYNIDETIKKLKKFGIEAKKNY